MGSGVASPAEELVAGDSEAVINNTGEIGGGTGGSGEFASRRSAPINKHN